MDLDMPVHRRRSIRLNGYDYSQPGAYFVTIVTKGRVCRFGEIVDGLMIENAIGKIILEKWLWLADQYEYVTLDGFCLMPNHFHGILIIIDGDFRRGGSRTAPTKNKTLGRLIGAFKTVSTKRINEYQGIPGQAIWQRNYYEHIVRDEPELARLRDYIQGNPYRWMEDEEFVG